MTALRGYPLAVAAVIAVVSIAVSDHFTLPGLPLLIGGALLGIGAWWAKRWMWGAVAVAALFAGLHAATLTKGRFHPVRAALVAGEPVSAEALIEIGRPERRGGRLATIEARAKSLRLLAMDEPDTFEDVGLRVDLPVARVPTQMGLYRVSGRVSAIRPSANPGRFDPVKTAERSGVIAQFEADRLEWVRSIPGLTLSGAFHGWAAQCRESIRARLSAGIDGEDPSLMVVQAMALGASDQTDPEIEEAFRQSGTLHVFAVSGLHVGLVSLIFWQLLKLTGLGKRGLILAVIPLAFAYAYITGWRPSAARASLMIALVLGSVLVKREATLINSLGAAALLLMIVDTQQLFLPGFQLSFGVLLAIALLAGPLMESFRPWTELDPFLPPALASTGQHAAKNLRRKIAGTLSVSTAAWLGSLPLLLWHFHTATPSALIANTLLVPLAFACLAAVCVSLCFSLVHLTALQVGANHLACFCGSVMMTCAGWFADLPGGSLHLASPFPTQQPAAWKVQLFALGPGAEAALISIGDQHWMIDAGNADDAHRILLPALREQGIDRLEGLLLTHGDSQHVGGAALLIQTLNPQQILHPLHEPWPLDNRLASMRQLLDSVPTADRSRYRALGSGDSLSLQSAAVGGFPVRMTVLYPGEEDRHGVADDRGLVLRLDVAGTRLLWMADAGFLTEALLRERGEDLRCDILVRGAHETDFHGTAPLLEAAHPQMIVSADWPAMPELRLPATVSQYAEQNDIHLLSLPAAGGIRIQADAPDGAIHIQAHRLNQEWTMQPSSTLAPTR